MMDFITTGPIANALAPKLQVGQDALYDALRTRDGTRAVKIIKRVSGSSAAARERAGARGNAPKMDEVDLNAPDPRGLRPIHLAAMGGLMESVVALVEAGVPVDAMGTGGNTALHLAAYHKQDGVVAVLMRAGASPSQENVKGKTAVDLAQTEMTMTLLCPLHYAAGRGMLDNLVALVAKGMSVNAVGGGGDTPLHAAAATGNTDAARLLLVRGADPLRRNTSGETPLDLARRLGRGREVLSGRDGIVWVLEGAASEAAAIAAAAEAIEAEKATARGAAAYHEGELVVYIRNEEEHPAVVMKVHHDDEEPYYTVRVNATGRERQTDANHLVRSSPQAQTTVSESASRNSGDSGIPKASGTDQANVENAPANANDSRPGGDGSASKRSRGDSVAAGCKSGNGDWAAAGAMFLEVASELRAAVEPGGAGTRGDGPNAPARALASAFSAAPASEVSAALLRRFLERADLTGEEGEHGGCGVGGAVKSSPGGAEGSEADTRGWPGKSSVSMCSESREEAIAHAVADACRDIVLTCLLGHGMVASGRATTDKSEETAEGMERDR